MLLKREEAERKLAQCMPRTRRIEVGKSAYHSISLEIAVVYPGINIYVWNFQLLTVSKIVGAVQVHRLVSNFMRVTICDSGSIFRPLLFGIGRYFSTDVRSSRVIDHHAIRILDRRDSMCLRPRSSRLLWAFL